MAGVAWEKRKNPPPPSLNLKGREGAATQGEGVAGNGPARAGKGGENDNKQEQKKAKRVQPIKQTHDMADNWRSKLITQGAARSPNRAMLRAVGFGDGDFDKAIVGVANGHSNMNPCNAGIQPLVDRAMAALKSAGAMPQVFGFPTVTDGIGMGTEGMKYSLVSREVIADAIETAVSGQVMDGVMRRRLRQEHARQRDGDGAHERAGNFRLRGHHQAGHVEGPGRSPSSARSRRSAPIRPAR